MHSSNLKWYAIILILVLILGFLIFLSLKTVFLDKTVNNTNPTPLQSSIAGDFSIFDSVNASLTGKITKVDDGKIFFENNKGIRGEALISEGVSISDMNKKDTLPSSDVKSIQLNKPAGINFNIKDGKYTVTSIIYPQP